MSLSLQNNFHDDELTNTFGIMKKDRYVPKSDFSIKLITMVEAQENTGYVAEVIRDVDNQIRLDKLQ